MTEKQGSSSLQKLRRICNTKALTDIYRWSACVHGAVVGICALQLISSLVSLSLTMVTKSLIDSATSGRPDILRQSAVFLVLLIAGNRLLHVWCAYLTTKSSARLQREMQRMVTDQLLFKDYESIKPYHSGELVNRVFSDVSVVKGGVINILPSLVYTAVSFIGAAIILIRMDWRFVPVLIVAGVLGTGLMVAFRGPMKRRHKRMQEAEDALHSSTQETLENIRVVKASGSEDRVMRQMEEDRARLNNEQIRNGKLSIAMNQGMGSMFDISWLLCNLWGCVKIYRGEFTYGSLAAMISLIGRIQGPIASAAGLVGQIYAVVASAERLQDVIDLPDDENVGTLTHFDRMEMRDVSFQYADGSEEVILHANATLRRGEFVALTGRSGAGKTSLFQLLLGIYHPTDGEVVFLDGKQEVRANRGTRGLFAYVPQGNTLFSGTLRENLVRFTDNATEADIAAAVRAACLEELVAEIGLDAVLGERGIGLSEGQAQRVAVARALLSPAPILMLDEATSALDEATEAQMLANISAMRERTVLIVTHRRAALNICNAQWRFEEGRLTCTESTQQPDTI